jgi:hypothetical protein
MTIPRVGTLIIWLCISMVGIVPLRPSAQESVIAAPQFNLFPIFGPDTNEFIGLSLVNTSVVKNEVSVTLTDSNGKSARTANLSLAPGSQRVALVTEIFAIPEDPAEGWIRIDSSEPGLLSYMTSGRDGILDATESASLISTRIMLPHVAVNTGFMELEYTETLINLINPGTAAANAHAELIGLDGVAAGDLVVSIPARASRTLCVSESFRDALPPNNVGGRTFRGYMKISSDEGLAGWLRIDTPLSRRLLGGRGVEEIVPARLAMVSHFAFGSPALYHSELNFINAGDSAVTLDLVAQVDHGGRFSVRRTLSPGQGFREDVLSLFRISVPAVFPPSMLTGYIRIQAADVGVFQGIGDIDITREGNAASMLCPIGAASYSNLILPFVLNDSDYFTGYAIANPNDLLTVQTDVTIELFDRDGRPVGSPRNVSLSPSARFVSLIEEDVRSGYLRIRANGPVALLGSIGTHNGSMLAPLPGLP